MKTLFTGVLMVMQIVLAIYGYRLARALQTGLAPWAWPVLMLLPLLNLLALGALSVEATKWLRAQGVAVGFLGPSAATVRDLKRSTAGGGP